MLLRAITFLAHMHSYSFLFNNGIVICKQKVRLVSGSGGKPSISFFSIRSRLPLSGRLLFLQARRGF
jgi:hypothetical protein